MNDHPAYPVLSTRTSTSLHCRATGCRDTPDPDAAPRTAERGTDLCARHHRLFPTVLTGIRDYIRPVRDAIVRTKRPNEAGRAAPRGSNRPDAGAMWNPDASAALAEATDWIGFLGRLVVNERPLPAPRVRLFERRTVTYVDGQPVEHVEAEEYVEQQTHGITGSESPEHLLSVIINHHARWLSGHPDAGTSGADTDGMQALGAALYDDAVALGKRMLRALDTNPVRVVRARGIACLHVINATDFGDEICGAEIFGIVQPDDIAKVSRIRCSADPEHLDLEPRQWMGYAAAHR